MKTLIVLLAIACAGYWYTEVYMPERRAALAREDSALEEQARPATAKAALIAQPTPYARPAYYQQASVQPRAYVAATPYPTPAPATPAPIVRQQYVNPLNAPPARVRFGH